MHPGTGSRAERWMHLRPPLQSESALQSPSQRFKSVPAVRTWANRVCVQTALIVCSTIGTRHEQAGLRHARQAAEISGMYKRLHNASVAAVAVGGGRQRRRLSIRDLPNSHIGGVAPQCV